MKFLDKHINIEDFSLYIHRYKYWGFLYIYIDINIEIFSLYTVNNHSTFIPYCHSLVIAILINSSTKSLFILYQSMRQTRETKKLIFFLILAKWDRLNFFGLSLSWKTEEKVISVRKYDNPSLWPSFILHGEPLGPGHLSGQITQMFHTNSVLH